MKLNSRTIVFLILGLALLGGNAWAQDGHPSSSADKPILLAANCTLGQLVSSGCTCPAPLQVVNGRCLGPGAQPGGQGLQSCPPNTRRVGSRCQPVVPDCKPGQSTTGFLCTCKPPLKVIGGVCKSVPDCAPGQQVASPCNCRAPHRVSNGVCMAVATAAPPKCKIGQRVKNCRCPAPYRVVNGKCACPSDDAPCFQP